MQILAIDSNYDPATQILQTYRDEHVYPYLESRGFKIIRCQGESARRDLVASAACRDDIIYITGAGHGCSATYTGDCELPVFQVGDYQPEEVKGKVVHLLSCKTAAKLGPDFVKHGCLAYFGYNAIFTFPINDYTDLVLECASEVDRAFADGLTAKEVYDRVTARYNQAISELKELKKVCNQARYDQAIPNSELREVLDQVHDKVMARYDQAIPNSELREVLDQVIASNNQGTPESELEDEDKDPISTTDLDRAISSLVLDRKRFRAPSNDRRLGNEQARIRIGSEENG